MFIVELLTELQIQGRLFALPKSIGLGYKRWKGVKNALAYCATEINYGQGIGTFLAFLHLSKAFVTLAVTTLDKLWISIGTFLGLSIFPSSLSTPF